MRFSYLIILFLIIFSRIHSDLFAQTNFSINGYYKNFSVAFDSPRFGSSNVSAADQSIRGVVNNRLRLNASLDLSRSLSLNLAYDFSPRIQDPSLAKSQLGLVSLNPYSYRIRDFDRRIYPDNLSDLESFAIFHNLDRLHLNIRTSPADIFIGRQAIAWGSARIINPTDIIAPFTFEELDTEDRIGVDAIRVRIPIGFMGEFDLGYVPGKDFEFENTALYVRSKLYHFQTDWSLLLLEFRENLLAGLDLARAIGGASVWFEAAYVFDKVFNNENTRNENSYLRFSTGLDYSFSGKLYGFIEYHFNGAGSLDSEDYLNNLTKTAYTDGSVYLFGKHYLTPGITYQFTPLINFINQALTNLNDPSVFFSTQVDYNIAKNVYLSGGIFWGVGKNPQFSPAGTGIPLILTESEFGSYPDIYYTSFRVYF